METYGIDYLTPSFVIYINIIIIMKADVNLPGFGGFYPLHGCVNSDTEYLDVSKLLLGKWISNND
jgi:hypothetical protein